VIVERWQSAGGVGAGQSFNYSDSVAKRWRQDWVGLGTVLHMEGGAEGGVMKMEGPVFRFGQDHAARVRATWSQLSDGRVRQLWERSVDGGKSWSTSFDGYYSRRRVR
jgi:hypothetical protein